MRRGATEGWISDIRSGKMRLRSFLLTRRADADYHPGTNMNRSAYVQGAVQQAGVSLLFVLALCVVVAYPAYGLPRHDNHSIHKQIEALEEQWRQAIISNNVTEMDHLLADDYIGIS